MNDFDSEKESFEIAVRNRAAVLIRDGYAAPYEAIDKARRQVMNERQAAARVRHRDQANEIFGKH